MDSLNSRACPYPNSVEARDRTFDRLENRVRYGIAAMMRKSAMKTAVSSHVCPNSWPKSDWVQTTLRPIGRNSQDLWIGVLRDLLITC